MLEFDAELGQELDNNLDEICKEYDLLKDEVRKSQSKYINNRNCHKLLGQDEVLRAKIP